jgi:vacuolar-type H+-ATPase subunit H
MLRMQKKRRTKYLRQRGKRQSKDAFKKAQKLVQDAEKKAEAEASKILQKKSKITLPASRIDRAADQVAQMVLKGEHV